MTIRTEDIQRPKRALVEALAEIGAATASGELSRLGISDPQIRGPRPGHPARLLPAPR